MIKQEGSEIHSLKKTENGNLVDFKGVTVKFVTHTSTTPFFLCLTHPSNTFIPSGDHKLFFLQFDRSLALGEKKKKKKKKKRDVTELFQEEQP